MAAWIWVRLFLTLRLPSAARCSKRSPGSSSLSLGDGSLQLPALLPATQAVSSRNSSGLDW